MKHKITHASIFSGIGGAELAAHWMGWRNLFHCEIQPFPRKVLDYWFPNSESYEDITKTDFTKWRNKVDVLTGGFPCQPFSTAGKRQGEDDYRYLWPEMLRAIREIQPSWIVAENVTGIRTMVQSTGQTKMGRSDNLFEESFIFREEGRYTLDSICESLESAGYSIQPVVIPACAVGAPHRRDRVWIIAHRSNARTEGVQQERQDGLLSSEVITNTHCNRQRDGANKQGCLTRSQEEAYDSGSSSYGIAPNAELGRSGQVYAKAQSQKPNGKKLDRIGCKRNASFKRRIPKNPGFKGFPQTQPVICGRDDGLPFNVDDLTISQGKWRTQSIKAYGNAWVPQVAYEIFKAIKQIEDECD